MASLLRARIARLTSRERAPLTALSVAVALGVVGGCYSSDDSCFGAGTLVATPNGPTPIERLRIGDRVLAYDLESEAIVVSKVTAVFVHELVRTSVVRLERGLAAQKRPERLRAEGDTELRVTPNHPIFSPETRKFVDAGTLRAGSPLLYLDGRRTTPGKCGGFDETVSRVETVYNITVERHHNYFANGVLVHNKSYAGTGGSGGTGSAGFGNMPGTGGTFVEPPGCGYSTPSNACGAAEVTLSNGWVVLQVPGAVAEGGAGNVPVTAGSAGLGAAPSMGGSSATQASAAVSGLLATCDQNVLLAGEKVETLRERELHVIPPRVPYRINLYRGPEACSLETKFDTVWDDGSYIYERVMQLPSKVSETHWNGAFTVEVESTTGVPLEIWLKIQ
jgi:hypothetical protein